jgi:nucleotide-binding universal stress UspA family protein
MASNQQTQGVSHVIAATDLSELGERAILAALRLARVQPRSELHVITVAFDEGNGVRLPWDTEQLVSRSEGEQRTKDRVEALIAPDAALTPSSIERINVYLTTGNPAHRVAALAQAIDAELIVCGTHGRTGLRRLLLGSVAEEIVRIAPCSVLVIRPHDFYKGEKIPAIDAQLTEGQHSLRPFHRAPTHHYHNRASAVTAHLPGTW